MNANGPEREESSHWWTWAPVDMEECDLGPAKELALATKEGQEDRGFS